MMRLLTTSICTALALMGCGSETTSEPASACAPGRQVSCPCPGGAPDGVQTCAADGLTFGACACEMVGDDSDAGTVEPEMEADASDTPEPTMDAEISEDTGGGDASDVEVPDAVDDTEEGDDCQGVLCNNHGTCEPGQDPRDGAFSCVCAGGWTGPNCETAPEVRDFVHDFSREEYREILNISARFYGAQRCGDTHNWLLSENIHGDTCHLEDGPALSAEVDLTGGWHDAGDFIKVTLTQSWTVYTLLKGFEVFEASYEDLNSPDHSGTPNGIPDLLDEVKVATDYLLKLHPDADTLVARVGGAQDHDLWVTSPYQSSLSVEQGGGERPVLIGAQADIAGITAAALAMMGRAYQPYDPDHASACLEKARSIYALGLRRQQTTPDPDNFYSDNTWEDSMLCGAVELYRSTMERQYLDQAIAYDEDIGVHYWVAGWDNNTDYCRHSLYLAGHTETADRWREDVTRYTESISAHPLVAGMAWFLDWGSLRFAINAALSSALFYDITGEDRYRDFAISQIDYVMGTNGYDRSFVVGWGNNPPQSPHHANAYGREALDWDLSQSFIHSLDGALVGGPTREAAGNSQPGYQDDIQDYVGNEVTLDYNAALVGTAAFIVSLFGE